MDEIVDDGASRLEAVVETPAPIAGIRDTPEFKAELAAFKAEILASLGSPKQDTTTAGTFDALAMAIATLTDQGVGRYHVPPDVVKARSEARVRLGKLVMECQRMDENDPQLPKYQLLGKVNLGDQLLEPFWIDSAHISRRREIVWTGIPNEAMDPMNESAKGIHAAFMDSIGNSPSAVVPADALMMTSHGAVLRVTAGGTSQTQAQKHVLDSLPQPGIPRDTVKILGGEHRPPREAVRILGTIMPPAMMAPGG